MLPAGVAYLVWRGVQAIRHRDALDTNTVAGAEGGPVTLWGAARQGVIVGVTNPKVNAMFAVLLPQFVAPQAGAVPLQMLLLGMITVMVGVISDGVWAVAAARPRKVLTRTPRRSRALIGTSGVMMIGLGGWLAVSRA